MADRQFLVARLVAETRRRLAPFLSHPRIDDNYRSTI
jgi:hypothetical protein